MKYKSFRILALVISVAFNPNEGTAQKKISFDLNISVLQSVGRDIPAVYHSNVNGSTVAYYSRSKFKHPYFNMLGQVKYSLTPKIDIGIQSGLYLYYLERYFSNILRTVVALPITFTFDYTLFNRGSNSFGVGVSGGKIYYQVDEFIFKIKNGSLFNLHTFYTFNQRNTLKLGIEKQIDNVYFSYTPEDPSIQKLTFDYHLNRVSIMLSYGLRLGK